MQLNLQSSAFASDANSFEVCLYGVDISAAGRTYGFSNGRQEIFRFQYGPIGWYQVRDGEWRIDCQVSERNQQVDSMVLEKTDRDLIGACQCGDREAFGRLFEIHSKRIFSIALRFSGDYSAAMDIVQDIFLKLLSSIGDFRGDSEFEAWMYRLVVNRSIDHIRRTRRLISMADPSSGAFWGSSDSFADLSRVELQQRVRWAVENLSPEQRIVVVLRYADELSYEDIARALDCSPGTVASRLNRAHKILHRRLAHITN